MPPTQLYPAATEPPPPANTLPSVSLTSPAAGATFAAPAAVPLAATASDSDGNVSRVEFLANGTLVGTDTTAPYAYSWSNVAAGSYNLVARATDDDGAVTSSTAVGITVNTPPPAQSGDGTGLSGQYFDEQNFTGASVTRVDPTVDFDWGLGSPMPTLNPDTYSVRWSGELQPRFSETYSIATVSDDGVRLWLDGQLVIDNWSEHSVTENAVMVALTAGRRYPVKLEYFEQRGAAVARLLWSSSSESKKAIQTSQLYPAAAPPPPPVNTAPSVSLTGPAAGSSYAEPAIVPLTATAADTDGSISRVEFFANSTLVGTDTTAPYAYTLVERAGRVVQPHGPCDRRRRSGHRLRREEHHRHHAASAADRHGERPVRRVLRQPQPERRGRADEGRRHGRLRVGYWPPRRRSSATTTSRPAGAGSSRRGSRRRTRSRPSPTTASGSGWTTSS